MKKKMIRCICMMCILAMMFTSIGCHSSKDIQNILSSASYEESKDTNNYVASNGEIVERVYYNVVYQLEGITASNGVIHSASWEDLTFEIICTDPTCTHERYGSLTNPTPTCSAVTTQNVTFNIESILYGGKRLLFVRTSEAIEYDEYGAVSKQCHKTDVYECDLDGKNRKKLTSFDGSWTGSTAGIICNNKLYFNNARNITYEVVDTYVDQNGNIGYEYIQYETCEFCSLDLETMEFVSYATKEKTNGWFGYFVITDNYLYCAIMDNDETILYRLDLKTNICEEVYRDSNMFLPEEAIGSNLLIAYNIGEDKWNIYLYNEETKTTKKILTDMGSHYCCILENQFAIMTETVSETEKDDEKDYVVEYSFFDESGNLTKKVHYNENIQFLFTLGEHLIYSIGPNEKSDKEVGIYEISIEDIEEIEDNGRYIVGGYFH